MQEAFDKMARGVIKQGKQAVKPDGDTMTCVLRTKDGLRCAIGQMIPAKQYRKWFEDLGLDDLAKIIPALRELDFNFLHDVRSAHDNSDEGERFIKDFKGAMRSVAEDYGLKKGVLREKLA